MDQKIEPLTEKEQAWLSDQLEVARRMMAAFSPDEGAETLSLEALDRAWSVWMDTQEGDVAIINGVVNAVGVALGQRLVDDGVFQWVIATDEHGADLAVYGLPGNGDVLIYPTNFVAKRYEGGETQFLQRSYEKITARVEAVQQAHARPRRSRPWWRRG